MRDAAVTNIFTIVQSERTIPRAKAAKKVHVVTRVREGGEGNGQFAAGQEGYCDASTELLQFQGAQAGQAQAPEHHAQPGPVLLLGAQLRRRDGGDTQGAQSHDDPPPPPGDRQWAPISVTTMMQWSVAPKTNLHFHKGVGQVQTFWEAIACGGGSGGKPLEVKNYHFSNVIGP